MSYLSCVGPSITEYGDTPVILELLLVGWGTGRGLLLVRHDILLQHQSIIDSLRDFLFQMLRC